MNRLSFFLIMLLVIATGCFKQNPPALYPDNPISEQDQRRDQRCGQIDGLDRNLLTYSKLLAFFDCSKWNTRFSNTYKAISSIQENSWDHLFRPLDRELYANQERQNYFFKEIKALNNIGSLAEIEKLSEIVFQNAQFDGKNNNLFSLVDKIFNGPDIVQHSIHNIFSKISLDEDNTKALVSLLVGILESVKENRKDLKDTFKNLLENDGSQNFRQQRLLFIDTLLNELSEKKFVQKELDVIPLILANRVDNQINPWILDWISSSLFTQQFYENLVAYPFDGNPSLINDMRVFKSYFSSGIGEVSGPSEIDIKRQFEIYIKHLASDDYLSFFRDFAYPTALNLLAGDEGYSLSKITSNQEQMEQVDLKKMVVNLTDFLSNPHVFSITQYIHRLLLGNDQNKNIPLFFINILSSESFNEFNKLNELLYRQGDEKLKSAIFNIIKNLPAKVFFSLGQLTNKIGTVENISVVEDFRTIWNHLSKDEKLFLFDILDSFLTGEYDDRPVFDFFIAMTKDLSPVLVNLSNSLLKDEFDKNQTIQTIRLLSKQLKSSSVISEIKKILSRDYILEILKLVTKPVNSNDRWVKNNYLVEKDTDYFFDFQSEYKVLSVTPPDILDEIEVKRVAACIQVLMNEGTFYQSVMKLPEQCEMIESSSFLSNLFVWLNFIHVDYRQHYNQDPTFFTETGLLGHFFMARSAAFFKILDDVIQIKEVDGTVSLGIAGLARALKKQLFELNFMSPDGVNHIGLLDFLEDALKLSKELFVDLNVIEKRWFLNQVNELIGTNDDEIKIVVGDAISILKDYSLIAAEPKQEYFQQSSCKSYFQLPDTINPNKDAKIDGFGVDPCPRKAKIKETLERVLQRSAQVHYDSDSNEYAPAFLETLLAMAHPNGGIYIPFESPNPKLYKLSIKEALSFVWDLSKTYDRKVFNYRNGSISLDMDRLSQLEIVIRDIGFSNNFFGILFQNEAARAENYAEATRYQGIEYDIGLLNPTSQDGLTLYGRTLVLARNSLRGESFRNDDLIPADTVWKLENVLQTFSSLQSVTRNYRHVNDQSVYSYTDLFQAFLTLQVMTSAKTSRDHMGLLRSGDSPTLENIAIGDKHNSRIVVDTTNLSTLRNVARWLRDRISTNEADYFQFLNSHDFRRVDEKLLKKISLNKLLHEARPLLQNYTDGNHPYVIEVMEDTVDWLYDMDYNSIRHLENLAGNLAVILTYIGDDSSFSNQLRNQFNHNEIDRVLPWLRNILETWHNTRIIFRRQMDVAHTFSSLEKFSKLIKLGLSPTENAAFLDEKNIKNNCLPGDTSCAALQTRNRRDRYYRFINKVYQMTDRALYSGVQNTQVTGIQVLLGFLERKKTLLIRKLSSLLSTISGHFERLHIVNDGGNNVRSSIFFQNLADNFERILGHPHFNFEVIKQALRLNFYENVNQLPNQHKEELNRLVNYVLLPSGEDAEKSKFRGAMETIFLKHIDSFESFLDDVLPLIRLRPNVNPPLDQQPD